EGHPDWLAVRHESLCLDPGGGFRELFDSLGVKWADAAERYLAEADRPGSGYQTFRVAAEQPGRWRQRLTSEETWEVWSILRRIQAPWVERVAPDLEVSVSPGTVV